MTRKRAGASRKQGPVSKDQETIRLVNECILEGDIKELRRISAVRGLVNGPLRRKAWPLLLGLDPQACRPLEPEEYTHLTSNSRKSKDSSIINVDVARCLHQTNSYVGDHNREDLRSSLIQLLNAVVDGKSVFYYQGLHELASVLLLEVGESTAYHTLRHLVVTHLRDNTRQNIDATLEALNVLTPLLQAVDPEVAAHIRELELPSYFAISWMLTWFAHDVKRMTSLARLYDVFLACHPLMPLYLGTVAMLQVRKQILAAETMPELHTMLVNLDILKTGLTIDALAQEAALLIKKHPPWQLCRALRGAVRHSAAVEARLVDGAWWVPEKVSGRGTLTSSAIDWLLTRLPAAMHHGRLTLQVVTSTGVFFATAALLVAWTRVSQSEP